MKQKRTYSMATRTQARDATRERIVEVALAQFLAQAFEDVTLAQIGKAAGVSHQTVLNHFDSKEGVARAAAELLKRETAKRRGRAVPGDVRGVLGVLVGDYERHGDANFRWAAMAEKLETLAPLLHEARADHQRWLARVFGDRLPAEWPAHKLALAALHVATDVYTWKLLRRDLGMSRAETEHAMVELVLALFERVGGAA